MEEKITNVIYTQFGVGGVLLVALGLALWKIHSDLAKVRAEMAYQINLDLLTKRFEAYGALWSRMHDSAIYTETTFGPREASKFSKNLTEWYFSEKGGLLLTSRAREFYFALQDLLRKMSDLPGWQCNQRSAEPKRAFSDLLRALDMDDRKLKGYLTDLEHPERLDPMRWKTLCNLVSSKLELLVRQSDPKAGEAIYVAIQQVSSILRTNLVHELRSRLDVKWPSAW